jgi:D-lactate dehydrogenase (cytochrome)
MRDAASAAMKVIRSGVPVAAMEIMDDVQMNVINRAGATPSRVLDEVPTLFFKFSGTKAGVQDNMKLVVDMAKSCKGKNFIFAKTEKEAHDLWTARKEALWSMLSLREGTEVWSTDVAVPVAQLPDIIGKSNPLQNYTPLTPLVTEKSKAEMDGLGLFASILGHVGDGNFHESIMYNRNDPVERKKVEELVHNMVDLALEYGGACTGEHSIGLGKKKALLQELRPATVGVMQTIKRSLDPNWLLNPGKIFDAPAPQLTKSVPEAAAASTLEQLRKIYVVSRKI